MIYIDKSFSQKLERTEARANADFVETRARLESKSNASWIDVAGVYAMFDGTASPCTQTFGLGLFDEVTELHLERLESFFIDRGAPVFHEVSPMAGAAVMPLLNSRGYRPFELTSVMYRELVFEGSPPAFATRRSNPEIRTRIANSDETEVWAETAADGWSTAMGGETDFMLSFGRISARCQGAFPFLAELAEAAIATGMLFIYDDVCLLAGASTVPEGRNQGAQNALLAARLSFAVQNGCKLAIMGTSPGSQSQKNAQNNGFNVAYTRTKWHLAL
jgi:hypothetical protein